MIWTITYRHNYSFGSEYTVVVVAETEEDARTIGEAEFFREDTRHPNHRGEYTEMEMAGSDRKAIVLDTGL